MYDEKFMEDWTLM